MKFKLINFYKYDPVKDLMRNFNIQEALNDNWDHSRDLLIELQNAIQTVESLLNTKVGQELGKGLSSNDFTDEYIAKINNFDISIVKKFDELEIEIKRVAGIVDSYTRDFTTLVFKLTVREWIDTQGIDHVAVDRMDTPEDVKLISGYHSAERKEIYI